MKSHAWQLFRSGETEQAAVAFKLAMTTYPDEPDARKFYVKEAYALEELRKQHLQDSYAAYSAKVEPQKQKAWSAKDRQLEKHPSTQANQLIGSNQTLLAASVSFEASVLYM